MKGQIKIILLEDVRSDAEIIQRQLRKVNESVEVKWVQTPDQYKTALSTFEADVVVSDHSLQGFTSVEALTMLRDSGRNIPFILVTATISEEFAVSMMKEGIADYLLKDRLQRLPLAVTNALEKWQTEREKQRSLDLLVQNEKRFRAMIENSHDMIGVTDENLQPVFASSSYTRVTGRTLKEERTQAVDHVHPDDRSEYYSTLNKAKAEQGRYFQLQYRFLHKNGKYIWVEGTVINMLADEAIGGILFNLRDVTARKEAEESLQKSRANMTAIIENSNVAIYSIDRQFRYISFNSLLKKQLQQTFGLEVKVGDPVFEFLRKVDPGELADWERVYTEAFRGNRLEFEKEYKYGDHHSFTAFSINPIVDGHYVTGLACFAWDVTPQRLAAHKVAQSEARFRALIENNYDAIVMRDENRKVLYSSPSVKRMLGYSFEDPYDARLGDIVHPDDLPLLEQIYQKLSDQPNIPFSITLRLKRRNGTYMWTEGTVTNMLQNESVRGIVSNFRDITERKENELQREKITLDLIERNQNLEQYAYIVSHNLRAPVANILGISNLLEYQGVNVKDREASLVHLFDSARRLDDVIKDLNLILQLQQSINEQREDVDLDDLVKDIELSIQDLIRKTNVEITTNFSKVKSITTVKSYLYSIFHNLIINSIKYRREGIRPVITIVSQKENDRIKIRFVDNGLGIDLAAHKSNLFGLYKRFHPELAEGKGVGLFMTKTQVDALGGKISVNSQVNIGTEFIIEL